MHIITLSLLVARRTQGRSSLSARGLFALAGLTALLAFPCQLIAANQPDTIRIAGTISYANGKASLTGVDYVIENQGWLRSELAKRGIKFEWYPVASSAVGPLINEAFANHTIQFGGYGELPAIILNGNGASDTTRLLVPSASSDAYLVVPVDSTAKSIEDLKGQRLSINKGRPWELPLLRLLDAKGLTYNDFQIYNLNSEAGTVALATKNVDGLFTMSAYQLEDKGVGKIIWSTKQAPLSWKMGMGLWGAKDFIDQHPDLTQLVVTAYLKATYWASLDENREAIIHIGTNNGTSESVVRRGYDDPSLTWKQRWSPLFTKDLYDHYQVDIGYAVDKKLIRKPIDVNELLDNRFVTQALQDLQLQNYWSDSTQKAAAQTPPTTTPLAGSAP